MLWLGVTCCGVVPWAQTSNWNPKKTMEKKFQPIFTKNMVCTCTDCNQWLCSSEQGIHWNLPPEAAVLTTCKPLEGLLKLYQLFQKILRISSWMKIWKNKKDTNLLSLNLYLIADRLVVQSAGLAIYFWGLLFIPLCSWTGECICVIRCSLLKMKWQQPLLSFLSRGSKKTHDKASNSTI